MARHGALGQGLVRQARSGATRMGVTWQGLASWGRLGSVCSGNVRLGSARHGRFALFTKEVTNELY